MVNTCPVLRRDGEIKNQNNSEVVSSSKCYRGKNLDHKVLMKRGYEILSKVLELRYVGVS